jgi:hypothetical protein
MPASSPSEKTTFWKALVAELPAFTHFLQHWQVPGELRSEHYGITHFHHQTLVEAVDYVAPEQRLLELIDEFLNEDGCESFQRGLGVT